MTQILDQVRTHLHGYFESEPDTASVTFLGADPIEVLRFRSAASGLVHYVSLGCSRQSMNVSTQLVADPHRGPRAEVVLSLRNPEPASGLARSIAILAAPPAVDGVVLVADALIDLGTPLWARPSERVAFTAVLLGRSDIPDLPQQQPRDPVQFLCATPITATEAAWVRLKGAEAMRQAWRNDGVDVLDPYRKAAQPG
ncbi:suppressor of fused domain protein [Mycobacterium ulcerans]|uniref:Suppressor of fused-like domain-containing protein n=1 Tax=Mycobacterium ulcerans subsp. shinshuense TaxID=1124626 RepID=A0A1B4Y6X6_MYCUL|nr:suppressor of fused domain protein [Mycobacterium ulcerans]BAV42814.1 hypothetical protein SHTP_3839 [Mycobacterium ulcerans subsp. shinshuense]